MRYAVSALLFYDHCRKIRAPCEVLVKNIDGETVVEFYIEASDPSIAVVLANGYLQANEFPSYVIQSVEEVGGE